MKTKKTPLVYRTITGRLIPLSKLTKSERDFLSRVRQKYGARLEWTRLSPPGGTRSLPKPV